MELTHNFSVAAPIDQTWAALNDIESVAVCFPGAVVTSAEGDSFQGSCKVKLGPIALVYNGSGTFVEKDATAHTMKIEAKGKDKRGNGTAGADVRVAMTDTGGQTRVDIVTDLAITGKPAQFGRGVMQEVSNKLLGQFVECLQSTVGVETAATQEAVDAETAPAQEAIGAETAPTQDVKPVVGTVPERSAHEPGSAGSPTSPSSTTRRASAADTDDALDLGGAVLPVLLKAYWKPALGAAAAIGVAVYVATKLRRE